jgi:hypothetical protein
VTSGIRKLVGAFLRWRLARNDDTILRLTADEVELERALDDAKNERSVGGEA